MKYVLPLLALILLCMDADAATYRRHRAKEGFMGAPERSPKRSKKNTGAIAAGIAISTVGNAAIDELKESRTRSKSYGQMK
ncbi:MAG: hypothetical protein JSS76_10405 [Bacteroidetes bacterium]|nr:hypothetical protein [Bacteroidota bacterium]